MKYEVSWILINITFLSDLFIVELIVESNLEKLMNFLYNANETFLFEHALWIFGNIIAEEELNTKNILFKFKDLPSFFASIFRNENKKDDLIFHILWIITNILRIYKLEGFKFVTFLIY